MGKIKDFLFQNRDTRQTVIKNTFWLAAGQIGSRLFRAFIIIYAARLLGAAEYGVFSYVIGLAGFFTVFADLGVNTILTRAVSQKPAEAQYYFATAFWIKVVLLAITSILLISVAPYFSKIEAVKILVPFMALLAVFDGFREFSSAFFRGKEKMELEALLTIVTNVTITVLGFVVLYYSATAEALTKTYVLSASAGTILGILILRKHFARVFSLFKRQLLVPIIKAALPVALIAIIGAFMLNIDIVMLGFYRSAEEVGFYSASQKIVQVLYMLPAILAATLFPVFSRLASKQDKQKTRIIMERGISAVFLIALPLAVGGVMLGQDMLQFLYGSEYLPATLTFQILIITLLLVFPGILISNYILAHDKQKKLAPYAGVGAIGNVILNMILIPLYGIVGSAIATVGANLIYNGFAWRLAKKINNFSTFQHLFKIIAATILMSAVVFLLKTLDIHVLINIAVSGLIYLAILFTLKESVLQEIKNTLSSHKSK